MNTDLKKFIAIISGVSAVMILAGWVIFGFIIPEYDLKVLPFLLLFSVFISVSVHAYQLHLIKEDLGKFMRSNMVLTFAKLFLYSVFAIVYLAVDSKNALSFVICLMVVYGIFSFIEVAEITRIIRRKNR